MTTTTNTIFYDSFTLDATGETVGANLNGKAVEQSSIGATNWTSASVYINATNTFAKQSNGNGYILPNSPHGSSIASLPIDLGAGIYEISANLYPQIGNSYSGYLGLYFSMKLGGFLWQAGTTSLSFGFSSKGQWSLGGATNGSTSNEGTILDGSMNNSGWSSDTPPLAVPANQCR